MNRKILPVKNPKLEKYISDYYTIEIETETNSPMLVPPLGFPVIQFHYGTNKNFYNYKNTASESVIIGQLTQHYSLSPYKGLKFIGINFKPYGLYNLLQISPKELTNACIESKHIFGDQTVSDIRHKLSESNDNEKIEIIENLLSVYTDKTETTTNYVCDDIVDQMIQKKGMTKIKDIVAGKISTRTLERYFNKVIGIPPKLFCQILRHKLIMQLTYEKQHFDWQNAIFMGYYQDHSHLSKDFEKFSNIKPQNYLEIKNLFSEKLLVTS